MKRHYLKWYSHVPCRQCQGSWSIMDSSMFPFWGQEWLFVKARTWYSKYTYANGSCSQTQTFKPGNVIAEFYTRLTKDDSFHQENSELSRTKLFGASSQLQLDTHHLATLERRTGHCIGSKRVSVFHRAQVKRSYLASKHYGKGKRRNNCTVVFASEGQ